MRCAVVAAIALVSASAQAAPKDRGRRVGIEVDPLPFFSHGYSVHVVMKPEESARLRLGVGIFGYDLPAPSGDNAGFSVRQDAIELNAGVYPFDGWLRGGFFGLYGFEQHLRYERDDAAGEARRHVIVLAPAVGYQIMLLHSGPYITPWAALGVPIVKTGDNVVAGKSYSEPKIVPVLALHIGWEFSGL